MPNLDAKQIMDIDALTTNVKDINNTPTDLPTIQEIFYFAFIVISIYLTLWTLLATTTNKPLQSIISTTFTIANITIFIIFFYYIAKLLKSGVNFILQDQ